MDISNFFHKKPHTQIKSQTLSNNLENIINTDNLLQETIIQEIHKNNINTSLEMKEINKPEISISNFQNNLDKLTKTENIITLNNQNELHTDYENNKNISPIKGNKNIIDVLNLTKQQNKQNNPDNNIIMKDIQDNSFINPSNQENSIYNCVRKDNFIFINPNLDEIQKYQKKLNPNFITDNIMKFYSIRGEEMNYNEYYEDMKNYFNDLNKKQKEKNPRINKRKILYIHDSAMQLRSILFYKLFFFFGFFKFIYLEFCDKKSNFISGRNPFKKDDFFIDYDKDSEEEFLEENAEDIKSVENSDEEEKELDEEEDENKWIVPDGHLSQDEVSEIEDIGIKKFSKNFFLFFLYSYSRPKI